MFCNELEGNNRSIIIYVKDYLNCKQLSLKLFEEYVLLQLEGKNGKKFNITTIYRSPSSSQDNNSELCSFINDVCKLQGHKLIIDDFNLPNINW